MRSLYVDSPYSFMSVRIASKISKSLTTQIDVINVTASARNKALILFSEHRLPNTLVDHDSVPHFFRSGLNS
jgi:hypothetical protein